MPAAAQCSPASEKQEPAAAGGAARVTCQPTHAGTSYGNTAAATQACHANSAATSSSNHMQPHAAELVAGPQLAAVADMPSEHGQQLAGFEQSMQASSTPAVSNTPAVTKRLPVRRSTDEPAEKRARLSQPPAAAVAVAAPARPEQQQPAVAVAGDSNTTTGVLDASVQPVAPTVSVPQEPVVCQEGTQKQQEVATAAVKAGCPAPQEGSYVAAAPQAALHSAANEGIAHSRHSTEDGSATAAAAAAGGALDGRRRTSLRHERSITGLLNSGSLQHVTSTGLNQPHSTSDQQLKLRPNAKPRKYISLTALMKHGRRVITYAAADAKQVHPPVRHHALYSLDSLQDDSSASGLQHPTQTANTDALVPVGVPPAPISCSMPVPAIADISATGLAANQLPAVGFIAQPPAAAVDINQLPASPVKRRRTEAGQASDPDFSPTIPRAAAGGKQKKQIQKKRTQATASAGFAMDNTSETGLASYPFPITNSPTTVLLQATHQDAVGNPMQQFLTSGPAAFLQEAADGSGALGRGKGSGRGLYASQPMRVGNHAEASAAVKAAAAVRAAREGSNGDKDTTTATGVADVAGDADDAVAVKTEVSDAAVLDLPLELQQAAAAAVNALADSMGAEHLHYFSAAAGVPGTDTDKAASMEQHLHAEPSRSHKTVQHNRQRASSSLLLSGDASAGKRRKKQMQSVDPMAECADAMLGLHNGSEPVVSRGRQHVKQQQRKQRKEQQQGVESTIANSLQPSSMHLTQLARSDSELDHKHASGNSHNSSLHTASTEKVCYSAAAAGGCSSLQRPAASKPKACPGHSMQQVPGSPRSTCSAHPPQTSHTPAAGSPTHLLSILSSTLEQQRQLLQPQQLPSSSQPHSPGGGSSHQAVPGSGKAGVVAPRRRLSGNTAASGSIANRLPPQHNQLVKNDDQPNAADDVDDDDDACVRRVADLLTEPDVHAHLPEALIEALLQAGFAATSGPVSAAATYHTASANGAIQGPSYQQHNSAPCNAVRRQVHSHLSGLNLSTAGSLGISSGGSGNHEPPLSRHERTRNASACVVGGDSAHAPPMSGAMMSSLAAMREVLEAPCQDDVIKREPSWKLPHSPSVVSADTKAGNHYNHPSSSGAMPSRIHKASRAEQLRATGAASPTGVNPEHYVDAAGSAATVAAHKHLAPCGSPSPPASRALSNHAALHNHALPRSPPPPSHSSAAKVPKHPPHAVSAAIRPQSTTAPNHAAPPPITPSAPSSPSLPTVVPKRLTAPRLPSLTQLFGCVADPPAPQRGELRVAGLTAHPDVVQAYLQPGQTAAEPQQVHIGIYDIWFWFCPVVCFWFCVVGVFMLLCWFCVVVR